jgi:hypothetical protein
MPIKDSTTFPQLHVVRPQSVKLLFYYQNPADPRYSIATTLMKTIMEDKAAEQ